MLTNHSPPSYLTANGARPAITIRSDLRRQRLRCVYKARSAWLNALVHDLTMKDREKLGARFNRAYSHAVYTYTRARTAWRAL